MKLQNLFPFLGSRGGGAIARDGISFYAIAGIFIGVAIIVGYIYFALGMVGGDMTSNRFSITKPALAQATSTGQAATPFAFTGQSIESLVNPTSSPPVPAVGLFIPPAARRDEIDESSVVDVSTIEYAEPVHRAGAQHVLVGFHDVFYYWPDSSPDFCLEFRDGCQSNLTSGDDWREGGAVAACPAEYLYDWIEVDGQGFQCLDTGSDVACNSGRCIFGILDQNAPSSMILDEHLVIVFTK